MSRPINARGGLISPAADCKLAEQCAMACAAFIFPHCRWLSGRSFATRAFTSSAVDFSKRFFMLRGLRAPNFIIRLCYRGRSIDDVRSENPASCSPKLAFSGCAKTCRSFTESFENQAHEVSGKSASKKWRLGAIYGAFGAREVVRVHPRSRRAYAAARALEMDFEKMKNAAAETSPQWATRRRELRIPRPPARPFSWGTASCGSRSRVTPRKTPARRCRKTPWSRCRSSRTALRRCRRP